MHQGVHAISRDISKRYNLNSSGPLFLESRPPRFRAYLSLSRMKTYSESYLRLGRPRPSNSSEAPSLSLTSTTSSESE